MRYTESRLQALTTDSLEDIEAETADFADTSMVPSRNPPCCRRGSQLLPNGSAVAVDGDEHPAPQPQRTD